MISLPDLLPFLHEAHRLALLAGQELLRLRTASGMLSASKGTRRELVTAADRTPA